MFTDTIKTLIKRQNIFENIYLTEILKKKNQKFIFFVQIKESPPFQNQI